MRKHLPNTLEQELVNVIPGRMMSAGSKFRYSLCKTNKGQSPPPAAPSLHVEDSGYVCTL